MRSQVALGWSGVEAIVLIEDKMRGILAQPSSVKWFNDQITKKNPPYRSRVNLLNQKLLRLSFIHKFYVTYGFVIQMNVKEQINYITTTYIINPKSNFTFKILTFFLKENLY